MLEGDPHRLLEGMLIAARAIGASRGYIYVRAEYPLAVKTLRQAIAQAQEYGVMGHNILGSGMDFDITIGKGRRLCLRRRNGFDPLHRGPARHATDAPRIPSVHGLWGCPTNINNVETYCSVPSILPGAGMVAGLGTARSGGTKAFALTGAIKNSGLVEVPLGMALRELIGDIGGGCQSGRTFKAVQLGGPSGGCLPPDLLETRIDYETYELRARSWGRAGWSSSTTPPAWSTLRGFPGFQDESCGKCVPCRVGTRKMLGFLTRITHGQAEQTDLDRLLRLCETVRLGSLCGLGQTAPNPVLTTMRYFKDEYLAHIVDQRCPAGVCLMDGGRSRAAAPGDAEPLLRSMRHTATVSDGRLV